MNGHRLWPALAMFLGVMTLLIAALAFSPSAVTNITIDQEVDHVEVESSTGSDGEIRGASHTRAGVMTAVDKTRLDSLSIVGGGGASGYLGPAVLGQDYPPGSMVIIAADRKAYLYIGSATTSVIDLATVSRRENWVDLGSYVPVVAGINYRIAWKAAPDGNKCGNHSPPVTFTETDYTGGQAVESNANVLAPNSDQSGQVCVGIWRSDDAGGDPTSIIFPGSAQNNRYGWGSAATLAISGTAGQSIVSTWALAATWVPTNTFTID